MVHTADVGEAQVSGWVGAGDAGRAYHDSSLAFGYNLLHVSLSCRGARVLGLGACSRTWQTVRGSGVLRGLWRIKPGEGAGGIEGGGGGGGGGS